MKALSPKTTYVVNHKVQAKKSLSFFVVTVVAKLKSEKAKERNASSYQCKNYLIEVAKEKPYPSIKTRTKNLKQNCRCSNNFRTYLLVTAQLTNV